MLSVKSFIASKTFIQTIATQYCYKTKIHACYTHIIIIMNAKVGNVNDSLYIVDGRAFINNVFKVGSFCLRKNNQNVSFLE